jgi:hypothetical protein
MVFLSSRISPRTSTVILRERSPFATAVVTSAMFRTCDVRFEAIAFTESVRSFQVPATPGTIAWPPRRPSVPTSRATRVTSEAKPRSWSTIVLMASFSCRISPRTSTVILRERSPLATAMVTSAMLRTCAVRLLAIWLTESVRSFQTPDTPFTFAWPPSRPAVPTSSATRVTSDENSPICSIMRLTMVAERRNSPCSGRPSASSGTERVRSPLATPAMASVMVSTGRTRSSISSLTERSICAHSPRRAAGATRWRVWPSRPTAWPTRASSRESSRFCTTISLKASARRPAMPSQWRGTRTSKSPSRTADIAASRCCSGSSKPVGGAGGWDLAARLRRTVASDTGNTRIARPHGHGRARIGTRMCRARSHRDHIGEPFRRNRDGHRDCVPVRLSRR